MARGPKPGIRLTVEPMLNALIVNGIEPEFMDPRLQAAIRKAKFNGYFTLNVADEIACTVLSMHPFFIWGDEYEERVWFDMDDTEEVQSNVIAFPTPIRNEEAVAA